MSGAAAHQRMGMAKLDDFLESGTGKEIDVVCPDMEIARNAGGVKLPARLDAEQVDAVDKFAHVTGLEIVVNVSRRGSDQFRQLLERDDGNPVIVRLRNEGGPLRRRKRGFRLFFRFPPDVVPTGLPDRREYLRRDPLAEFPRVRLVRPDHQRVQTGFVDDVKTLCTSSCTTLRIS